MTVTCPNCQAANSDTGRFCMQCGHSLPREAPADPLQTGLLPPNMLLQGRYIIVQLLGRGGMGAVYAATDSRITGKRWAVKEMSDAAITNALDKQDAVQAFRQEAEMLARLSHPNLPAVTDFFSQDGKQYLVMEMVQGKTLAEVMATRQAPCNEGQTLQWAEQLCHVLQYLHAQDPPIIFRDLKPGNIMLEDTGLIKLIDFGIARHFKPGRAKDTLVMGTPGYAAPEQYGHGQTDARSDVYSLGVTLHHLLTRYDPGLTPFNLPPVRVLNPAVSPRVEAVIQRATRTNPHERYQSIAEMRRALQAPVPEDLERTERELVAPVPLPVPAGRSLPGWVRVAGGLVGVLLCLALGISALVVSANLLGNNPTVPATTSVFVAVEEEPSAPTEAALEEEPATSTSEPDTATPTLEPATATATAEPSATPTMGPLEVVEGNIGRSANGAELLNFQLGTGTRDVIIIGGLHAGFAPSTVEMSSRLVTHFANNPMDLPPTLRLHIIPNANPDSADAPGEKDGRLNGNGVDLNRNFGCNWAPTATWLSESVDPGSGPFSEPETEALRDYILGVGPVLVIYYEARATNGIVAAGNCGGDTAGSGTLVAAYAAGSGYDIHSFTNLTGDSADWTVSQGIASLSILVKEYATLSSSDWQDNLDGLLAVFKRIE